MKEHVYAGTPLPKRLRRAAIVIVAGAIAAAAAVHANPSNSIVVVPPADLPEMARQGGEAMMLRETLDGRTLLYVEQNQGTRLATFDVTDPVHVKGKGAVQLDGSGAFDFLFALGDSAQLVRYRGGRGDAVLNLRKIPTLTKVVGLDLQGPTIPLGHDGYTVSGPAASRADAGTTRDDLQVIDTANSPETNRVLDLKQVRQEMTNAQTGTTFVLTETGLYLIRRPAVETVHQALAILPN
jgi:hypothetical protein